MSYGYYDRINIQFPVGIIMKIILMFLISLGLVAGCTAGPKVKTYSGPTGEQMSTIRCTKETAPCFEKASETCSGGSYRVANSYRNAGGLVADALPGPVTWYTMNIICGPSDGVMPTFPLRGTEPAMPDTTPVQRTECHQTGDTVNCKTY